MQIRRLQKFLGRTAIHSYQINNYSLRQYYSKFHPDSAWSSAPLLDIHKFVQGLETNMPANANFSILHPSNITRNLLEIREIFNAIGIKNHPIDTKNAERQLRDLVVLRPKRALLHEIIIQITTQVQLEDDEDFAAVVKSVYKELLEEVNAQSNEFKEMFDKYPIFVNESIETYEAGNPSKNFLEKLIDPIFETVQDNALKGIYIPGKNETVKSVVGKIITDDLLRKHISLKINEIVEKNIEYKLKMGFLNSLAFYPESEREDIFLGLTRYENEERVTFMVAGGPASGKGILTKRIAAMLKLDNMPLKDFAMIAPDRYKTVLSDSNVLGKDKSFHGTLTQEECRLLAEQCRDRILQMAKMNFAPNTFIEMLVPYEDKVELGTYGGGKFRVYVASTDPVLAVEGSFKRFKDIGRFVPKEYVLEGQSRVSAYIPQLIADNKGKNRDIRLEIHDTTGTFGDKNTQYRDPIAIIKFKSNTVIIFDLPKMFEFIKKEDINSDTKDSTSIFHKERSISELAAKLIKCYGQGIIQFIDSSSRINSDNIEQKVYAIYNNEIRQIEIINPDVFDKIIRNEIYKETFKKLDVTILEDYKSTIGNRQKLDCIRPNDFQYKK